MLKATQKDISVLPLFSQLSNPITTPATVTRKRRYKAKAKHQSVVSQDDKIILLWKVVNSNRVPIFRHPVSHYPLSKEASKQCLKASLEHPNLEVSQQVIKLIFSRIARGDIEKT